ncbi:MAG: histidine kinase [Bacteroidales bacterium]|jgi:signal transduction histidine kinase|nr:histidine kinase [Bacteroidales bacterium]
MTTNTTPTIEELQRKLEATQQKLHAAEEECKRQKAYIDAILPEKNDTMLPACSSDLLKMNTFVINCIFQFTLQNGETVPRVDFISNSVSSVLAINKNSFFNNSKDFTKNISPRYKFYFFRRYLQAIRQHKELIVEFPYHAGSQLERWIYLRAYIIKQTAKQSIWCGFLLDVTPCKHQYLALLSNEKTLKLAFEHFPKGLIIHTTSGKFITINKFARKILAVHNVNKQNLIHCLPENIQNKFYEHLQKLKLNKSSSIECSIMHKKPIPVKIKSKIINNTPENLIFTVVEDLQLKKLHEQELVRVIIETEEKERARFASDLHDDIGATLSTIKLLTGLLDTASHEKLAHLQAQLSNLITNAIQSVRNTSHAISPHILTNHGIIAAIKSITLNLQETYTIHIDTNCETLRFSPTLESMFYRIVFELLNNTIKHAQASKISISLNYTDSALHLDYTDNGKGFAISKAKKNSQLGLYNIFNRIKTFDSEHSFTSQHNKGVHFSLKIPATVQNR